MSYEILCQVSGICRLPSVACIQSVGCTNIRRVCAPSGVSGRVPRLSTALFTVISIQFMRDFFTFQSTKVRHLLATDRLECRDRVHCNSAPGWHSLLQRVGRYLAYSDSTGGLGSQVERSTRVAYRLSSIHTTYRLHPFERYDEPCVPRKSEKSDLSLAERSNRPELSARS